MDRKNVIYGLVVGLVSIVISNSAFAIPLTIVESIDYANSNGSGADLGSLDIGINTVSGSVLRDSTATVGFGDYGDFWEVDLLTGQQITSIEIAITNHSGELGFFVGAADANVGGFGPFNAQAYANLSTNGDYTLAATIGSYPFDAGRYYFGAATNVGTNTGYSYEWRISVAGTTTDVPEPPLIGLFAAGLFVIGFARRRMQK